MESWSIASGFGNPTLHYSKQSRRNRIGFELIGRQGTDQTSEHRATDQDKNWAYFRK